MSTTYGTRTFYHYTSTEAARGIESELQIRPSTTNAGYGPGVYGNNLHPKSQTATAVLKNNYCSTSCYTDRAAVCFEVHVRADSVKSMCTDRSVLLHSGPIDLRRYKYTKHSLQQK